MTDREKVIQALDCCLDKVRPGAWASECIACPYAEKEKCRDMMIMDALALLKEQENCENCAIAIEDRQPVVRCKDCKHGGCRTQRLDGSIFRVVCKKHGTKKNELWMDADWFCADGEVKDDA